MKGKSDKTRNKNIREILSSYKKTGKIGNIKPKSMAHAQEIAAAIAYRQQREG